MKSSGFSASEIAAALVTLGLFMAVVAMCLELWRLIPR